MKYYVICPPNTITGGPDALHQMVYYLRQLGKEAEIVYLDEIVAILFTEFCVSE